MKPMLASPPKGDIQFPVLASPKIDGVRCLIVDGVAVSRSLKPIRNEYVQSILGKPEYNGLDGELVVGSEIDPNCMQNTTSGVMRIKGEPDFRFCVFDDYQVPGGFAHRYDCMRKSLESIDEPRIVPVEHAMMFTQEHLDRLEAGLTEKGFEGVMVRSLDGPYKHGRSTAKQGYLLKIKRFEDGEAEVIDVLEMMHNENEAKTNELGRTERSTAKEGLVPAGVMGKLVVRDLKTGVEFEIGTGFSAQQRADIWKAWHAGVDETGTLGSGVAKYKHFANGGVVDKPRFPVFLGFRDPEDMS